MKKSALALAFVVSVVSSPVRAQAPGGDPELAKGKDQVRQGEYDSGIATLTEVVRRLHAVPDRDAEAADAYLHLGIAYAGLGQTSPARSQFVQALKRDPAIAPDPKTAPPLALEAFAAARGQAEQEGVLAAARQAKRKKGHGGTIALVAGAVGAGVGVAVAAGGGGGGSSTGPPRIATFVPVSTSPFIQLVTILPDPGSTFSSNLSVSITLKAVNTGTNTETLFFAVDAVTADGRACISGQTLPFSFSPGSDVTSGFSLRARCTAPFTTESLEIFLQDPATNARPYHATYRGRYQVVP